MLALTMLVSMLAGGEGEERVLLRIKEPGSTVQDVSINARLLILAEILPADSFDEAWVEVRRERFGDWQRRLIPASRRVRVSQRLTVVGPMLEPRSLPGVKAGDSLEVRIVATGRAGDLGRSPSLQIRVHDPIEREARLLSQVDQAQRSLQNLRAEFEGEHRRISRIHRNLRDAAPLDNAAAEQLVRLESVWTARSEELRRLSGDLRDALDEGSTDQLIDSRRENRWRRSIIEVLRECDSDESPLTAMRRTLPRAIQAKAADERRVALHSILDASDRFLDLLQKTLSEVEIWQSGLDIRRVLRSMLQGQKAVTGELETEVERRRRR